MDYNEMTTKLNSIVSIVKRHLYSHNEHFATSFALVNTLLDIQTPLDRFVRASLCNIASLHSITSFFASFLQQHTSH